MEESTSLKSDIVNFMLSIKRSELWQERDHGVIVDSLMKMSTQCAAARKKAKSMVGIVRKGRENKKLKKFIKTPEIPSKHVRNWVPKVLEQRRQGLEAYLQSIILENEELPKLFLDFLSVRHFPSLPKAESCGSFEETESEESSKLSHQPVLLFLRDPYVLPTANDDFPNVVIEGVLHGLFYPHLQPR
ncbi:sorting nexin-24 isoform X1 [Rhineura floridana]|uniref:sorting nexin-24 isoform X1 n=1 Tax=Rhineura floridana TaxID=261503 RepID=UPI002AC8137F|nr:sorting nexin-24 isoform X1 [Rhineura floridana]XP_061463451.1 sorting nexin-24 isoform X1 [Rhineura floridana]